MEVRKAVLEAVEEIIGLSEEDLVDNMDTNIWEEGLLDSVGSAIMIANVEDSLNVKVDLDAIGPDDFASVNSIIATFERLIR